MPRIRAAALIAALASLVIAGTALAAKVSGGTATITPSSAASTLLANNHITVTPVAPATSASGAITFPIGHGRINGKTLHGQLKLTGGLQLSNGTKTVTARDLHVVSVKAGAWIVALVRDHTSRFCTHAFRHPRRIRCILVTHLRTARIAKITGGSVSGTTFTGNVAITAFTANLVNRLAGSSVVSAGAPLGTVSITATIS